MQLHLKLNSPALAIAAGYRAVAIGGKNIRSLEDLVDALLAMSKSAEALRVAKEALQLMPKNPRAVVLVGRVFAAKSNTRNKAVRAFSKAVKMDPSNASAAVLLADNIIAQCEDGLQADVNQGIAALQNVLRHGENANVHARLADLHTIADNHVAALG